MSKYTDWLNEPIEYAKEIGDHLVYLPIERAVELMVHLAISAGRIEYLEEENDRYCNGYKGGCWTCESVADLNVKQEARIAELEAENQRLRAALGQVHTACYSMTKTREIVRLALLGGGDE